MVGPGEVADINLASRASVVIVLPWVEGGRGSAREVKSWVKIEVDGIAHGAWVSRAPAAARSSRDGNEGGASGGDGAAPGDSDPGRSHAAGGSVDPPPAEDSTGDHLRWVGEGLGRVGGASG